VDILKAEIRSVAVPAALLLLSVMMAAVAAEDDVSSRDHLMKAATIYKFAHYIHWPEDRGGQSGKGALSICLLGGDLYDGALAALQDTGSVVVRQVDGISHLPGCDILVIGTSEQARLEQVLEELQGHSIVTVSEIDRFTDRGGMIRLYDKNNRIRFDINLRAAREAELRFDLRLVRLSVTVRD